MRGEGQPDPLNPQIHRERNESMTRPGTSDEGLLDLQSQLHGHRTRLTHHEQDRLVRSHLVAKGHGTAVHRVEASIQALLADVFDETTEVIPRHVSIQPQQDQAR